MKTEKCIFCNIVEFKKNLIYEDLNTAAFLDIAPITKGHILVIPKKHFKNFIDTELKIIIDVIITTHKIANLLMKIFSDIKGFNILINNGKEAFQEIFHYHVHIIPKYIRKKGFLINKTKENINIYEFNNIKNLLKLKLL